MRLPVLILSTLISIAPAAAQMPVVPVPTTLPPHGDTPPVDYAQANNWICRPGVDDGTCSANLDAMRVDAAGTRQPVPYVAAKDPPIDCFYVYPTASTDRTLYSDLVPDAEEKRSVHGQAARLGAACRVFVPAYHQLTITALRYMMAQSAAAKAPPKLDFDTPYRDILAAWRSYMARDNHGRGVVLVGHSQGAIILKRLIAEEMDGKPAQKQLVAAYLAGNPDLDQRSFKHISACKTQDQSGCVVAWSTYFADYEGPRTFGGTTAGAPLCVNPAAVGGGRGALDGFLGKPSFAPPNDPPAVEMAGQLSGECVSDDKGAVLRVRVEPGKYADLLRQSLQRYSPAPTWGLHPLDISLVQGNMISLIRHQTKAWQTQR
ncbi:DUF3089 domain-containing protein [Sphingomonas sp.]|uniref:DUF3089 domain-containing protein n=1 Tax=Sphingomonas sp. TaxID=28214 RepID=UPI003B3A07F0